MKLVISSYYGDLSLSEEAKQLIKEKGGNPDNIERHNSILVEVVEKLGGNASNRIDSIGVVEIGDTDRYCIQNYYGAEVVYTPDTIPWIYVGNSESSVLVFSGKTKWN